MSKIKVTDFVKGYEDSGFSSDYIKDTIEIQPYVGYLEKITLADRIVKSTSYEVKDGEQTNKIYISSASRYVVSMMNVLSMYTNLDVDMSSVIEEYDRLQRYGLIKILVDGYLPHDDLAEFDSILNMYVQDFMTNHCDIGVNLANVLTQFKDVAIGILQSISPEQLSGIADVLDEIKDLNDLSDKD